MLMIQDFKWVDMEQRVTNGPWFPFKSKRFKKQFAIIVTVFSKTLFGRFPTKTQRSFAAMSRASLRLLGHGEWCDPVQFNWVWMGGFGLGSVDILLGEWITPLWTFLILDGFVLMFSARDLKLCAQKDPKGVNRTGGFLLSLHLSRRRS